MTPSGTPPFVPPTFPPPDSRVGKLEKESSRMLKAKMILVVAESVMSPKILPIIAQSKWPRVGSIVRPLPSCRLTRAAWLITRKDNLPLPTALSSSKQLTRETKCVKSSEMRSDGCTLTRLMSYMPKALSHIPVLFASSATTLEAPSKTTSTPLRAPKPTLLLCKKWMSQRLPSVTRVPT